MIGTVMGTGGNDDGEAWVDAAPFRAQLRYLMAVSELTYPCIALLAGISPRLAFRLLYGRAGRPLRRISPDTARKLLRLSAAEARAVAGRAVPAQATVLHLRRLESAGWSRGSLATLLGLTVTDLAHLQSGAALDCTQLVALRAAAEVTLLQTPLAPLRDEASDAA